MEQRRIGPALHVARRALHAERAEDTEGVDGLEAVDALFDRLGTNLVTLVGPAGWEGLLRRALAEAATVEPRLAHVRLDPSCRLRWVPKDRSAAPPGPEAFAPLLASVIEVLGRIVGSEMAIHLVELGLPESGDV